MRHLPAILALLLATATGHAQNAWMKTATLVDGGHRLDHDTTGAPTTVPASLTNGLVMMLPFSVNDDTTAYDVSSTGNDATATNANTTPTWSAADGGIVNFDGVNDYMLLDSTLTGSSGSVTAWVRVDSLAASGVIMGVFDTDSDTRYCYVKIQSTGKWRIQQRDNDTFDSVETVATFGTNAWKHCAITSSGSAWVLYLDGIVQSLTVVSGSNSGDWWGSVTSADQSAIGVQVRQSIPAGYFFGDIDDLRNYTRVLTSNEVFAIYTGTQH